MRQTLNVLISLEILDKQPCRGLGYAFCLLGMP
jgi:hypothetical protein